MLQGDSDRIKRTARRLRKEMTLPERLLWQRLRRSPSGLKFRRQHDAGKFVLDFYCHPARTVIEVDGIVHDMGDQPFKDEDRDDWLKNCGMLVLRIPARDVLADADGVAEAIVITCSANAARKAQEPRPF